MIVVSGGGYAMIAPLILAWLLNVKALALKAWPIIFGHSTSESPLFYYIHFLQGSAVIYGTFIMYVFDSFFAGIMITIAALLNTLREEVIELHKMKKADKQAELFLLVKKFKLILRISQLMQTAFGPVLIYHFMHNYSGLGVCIYTVVKSTDVSKKIPLTFGVVGVFSQMFIYCNFSEEIVIQTENLRTALYMGDWYNQSKNYKFLLIFTLQRLFLDPYVDGRIFILSRRTLVTALRLLFAYYTFLSKF